MNIIFSGKDDVRSTALEELCEKKLTKLAGKVPSDNLSAEVNFSLESKDHVLTMKLFVDGDNYTAKTKGMDMYKNIDECVEKLKTQIMKNKVNKKGSKKPDIAID
ncbi:MAG: HPF/RaiA family ribosome-associated protein [Clostridia bacterium]|nr:HPF/RaiA family ribosome-associated protein [Clostridia bacterium]